MTATVHDLQRYREKHGDLGKRQEYADLLWSWHDDFEEAIVTVPTWMVLKIMTVCRQQLKSEKGG